MKAYLEKDKTLEEAVYQGSLEHERVQTERVWQNQEARAAYRLQSRIPGVRMIPEYHVTPYNDAAIRRVLNLPANKPSTGHRTALSLLPYPNIAIAGVFDAMHNLLLGVNKTILRRCVFGGEYKAESPTNLEGIDGNEAGSDSGLEASFSQQEALFDAGPASRRGRSRRPAMGSTILAAVQHEELRAAISGVSPMIRR